jgi:hypothetical protein
MLYYERAMKGLSMTGSDFSTPSEGRGGGESGEGAVKGGEKR